VLFYSSFMIFSDFQKIKENFSDINLIYIPIMISFFVLSMIIRSIFQNILLRKISVKLSLKFNIQLFISGLSMLITPGGSGQIIKSQILKEKYNISIKKSLPVIITERFFDLIAVSIILIFTLFYYNSIETFILISISCLVIVLIILLTRSKKVFKKCSLKLKRFSIFRQYVSDEGAFYESVQKLFSFTILVRGLLLIIPVTFLDGLTVYLGFLAFDVDLGYIQTIQFYYSSLLAGVFSFIPGGLAIMESSFTLQLLNENISLALSTSITIFVRLLTIWLATLSGFIVYFSISKNRK